MKFSPDDPILTAYVLGELDPSEFAEVEAAVLEDPELQVAVSDLRGLQENLVFELVVEPEVELTRDQRKEVLAKGRSDLLAQSKSLTATGEVSSEVIELSELPEDNQTTLAGKKLVSFPLIVLSGTIAACVALTVSWLSSQWQQGSLFAENQPLEDDRQDSQVFASSDVAGFDEPTAAEKTISVGAADVISVDEIDEEIDRMIEQLSDSKDSDKFAGSRPINDVEAVPEIPRVERLSGRTRYGAGVGDSEPSIRFPRAKRSPSELGSRVRDDFPEPPVGYEESNSKDEAAQPRRSEETPYRWTRESSVSEVPTEVDTVSYSNVRRYLRQGQLPPTDSVHIEEMINFFDYLKPAGDGIFGVDVERAICPWEPDHHLVRIAVQASATTVKEGLPARNYVFLIDSSESMRTPGRLGMLSESAVQMVESLTPKDRVTIFTYEDDVAHLVAGPLTGNRRETIRYAFENLDQSRRLTGTPIRVAFRAARNAMIADGENRVILVTDEHLHAGAGTSETLIELASLGRKCEIGLTVAGVGGGVLDADLIARLEVAADVETHYLDGAGDAARFFGKALAKPDTVLANRVAINVDFNSEIVRSYRLIGFANRPVEVGNQRTVKPSDVRDGYALTALYEIIPMAAPVEEMEVGTHGSWAERESDRVFASTLVEGEPLLNVSLLYDPVGANLPKHTIYPVPNLAVRSIEEQSGDFQFAAAVAGYGMLLRESPYGEGVNTKLVRTLAEAGLTVDPYGLKREFLELVRASEGLGLLP